MRMITQMAMQLFAHPAVQCTAEPMLQLHQLKQSCLLQLVFNGKACVLAPYTNIY